MTVVRMMDWLAQTNGYEMKIEEDDRKVVAFAVRNFGSNGGPVASTDNIEFFSLPHTLKCIKRACESENVSETAKKILRKYL